MALEIALSKTKPVNLTGAYEAKWWYEKPSFFKKYGLAGILILTNLLTIGFGFVIWNFLQLSVKYSFFLNQVKNEQVQNLTQLQQAQATKIANMEHQIGQMIEFQSSSPADVLRIGKTIAQILTTASGAQQLFLEQALPQAIRLQVQEEIPASAVIAMAIYESGYGRSELARVHYNYFGMKAFSNWDGKVAGSLPTKDNGVATQADFRSYDSLYEGFKDFAQMLKQSDRYRTAFQKRSGLDFVSVLLHQGYCPDSHYLSQIQTIIRRHRLTELESLLEAGEKDLLNHETTSPALSAIRSESFLTDQASATR